MCVICAKPKGVKMPSYEYLENMYANNPDGAGFMYAADGAVHIQKGFMKEAEFWKALEELEDKYDLTKLPMVLHFRITTHGGTKPENCHPFPITDSMGKLKKLKNRCPVGVAHNGIIHGVTPRKGISDTMEYIASQLAPLNRAVPQFYKNKDLMEMIRNATESKLAFLTASGKIYTVGPFVEESGIKYSNTSYKTTSKWRQYTCSEWDTSYGGWTDFDGMSSYVEKEVMWLDPDEEEFVFTADGQCVFGYDCAIDKTGKVYALDSKEDVLYEEAGAIAYDKNMKRIVFNGNEEERLVSKELCKFNCYLPK